MVLRGTVFSHTLEMETGITIVTPNSYKPVVPYKVAYLLHGLCGSNATWIDYSMLPVYAGKGDTIYVLPEVARSFFTDMKLGLPYFTYISRELPEIASSVFNISARREDTAVIGASMGGYGALKCALTRPEVFGMCGAFSSGCLFLAEGLPYQKEHRNDPEYIASMGARMLEDMDLAFGKDLACQPEDDIMTLARKLSGPELPRIYTCCGDKDGFLESNRRLKTEMEPLPLDVTYQEWEGSHDFHFFNEALDRAIRFFDL